jgi:hypothetical protein
MKTVEKTFNVHDCMKTEKIFKIHMHYGEYGLPDQAIHYFDNYVSFEDAWNNCHEAEWMYDLAVGIGAFDIMPENLLLAFRNRFLKKYFCKSIERLYVFMNYNYKYDFTNNQLDALYKLVYPVAAIYIKAASPYFFKAMTPSYQNAYRFFKTFTAERIARKKVYNNPAVYGDVVNLLLLTERFLKARLCQKYLTDAVFEKVKQL